MTPEEQHALDLEWAQNFHKPDPEFEDRWEELRNRYRQATLAEKPYDRYRELSEKTDANLDNRDNDDAGADSDAPTDV